MGGAREAWAAPETQDQVPWRYVAGGMEDAEDDGAAESAPAGAAETPAEPSSDDLAIPKGKRRRARSPPPPPQQQHQQRPSRPAQPPRQQLAPAPKLAPPSPPQQQPQGLFRARGARKIAMVQPRKPADPKPPPTAPAAPSAAHGAASRRSHPPSAAVPRAARVGAPARVAATLRSTRLRQQQSSQAEALRRMRGEVGESDLSLAAQEAAAEALQANGREDAVPTQGYGAYADAEEDAQLGPEGLKGQNMAAAGAEQWAVGAHLEAQDSLGSWCAPRSQDLVHARRRPHHLSSAGTRPWSWAAGAWAARAQSS